MKEPNEDDERLAALLEGRVQGDQREDMLARLAAADDDYEVFAGTAGVLRALEEEDARDRRPGRVPSMGRGGWRVRTTMVVTGTVVLLLALGLVWKGRSSSLVRTPQQLALAVYPSAQGLPAGWQVPAPSGGVRGGTRGAKRTALAVHAGAMLVDLSIAIRTRDTTQTRILAETLNGRLDEGVSDTPLDQIAVRPGAPEDSLNALLDQAAARLADRRKELELGAWLEAARLAANERKAAFFEDGASDDMLGRASRLARGNDGARATVASVRKTLPVGGTARWDILGSSLATLLSELSG